MSVIINELEHFPAVAESRPEARRGGGSGASGRSGDAPGQVMQAIRRESSRQARLWAD